jgi:hypothetical protein
MILDDRARGDTNAYVPVAETVRDTRFELCDLKLHLLDVRSCCVEVGRSHSGRRCQDAISRALQRCLAGRIGRLAAIVISVESCLVLYKVILPTLPFSSVVLQTALEVLPNISLVKLPSYDIRHFSSLSIVTFVA